MYRLLTFATLAACSSEKQSAPPVPQPARSGFAQPEAAIPISNQSLNGNDSGNIQPADIAVTVNGSSSPQLVVRYNQPNSMALAARSVNFPARRIVIFRVEMQPRVANATPVLSQSPTASINMQLMPNDPTTGSIEVSVRDLTACEQTMSNGTDCNNFNISAATYDSVKSFAWNADNMALATSTNSRQTSASALLGAGIGALAGMISTGSASGAFNGALRGLTSTLNGGYGGYSGGASYGMGYGTSYLGNGTAAGYGQYPGYGYPGLAGNNLYGGYNNGTGYGYGSPGYNNYSYNPNGWSNGITNNPYYSSNNYYNSQNSNGYNNSRTGSNYGYDDRGVNNYNSNNTSAYDSNYNNSRYGSAGYYRGYNQTNTYGRAYDYTGDANYGNSSYQSGYNLTPSGDEESGVQQWLAH